MIIWLDVEDLFQFALAHARPTGIQRLSFEIYRALMATCPEQVRFCRHDRREGTLRAVNWEHVEALFATITVPQDEAETMAPRTSAHRRRLRRWMARLPADITVPLGDALQGQKKSLIASLQLGRVLLRDAGRRLRDAQDRLGGSAATLPRSPDIRQMAAPGDVLLALGAPWSRPDYAAFIARITRQTGLRFGVLVYDLIPIIRPEFCDVAFTDAFRDWCRATLPVCDQLFAISESTAADLSAWAAGNGIALRNPVRTIPIGTGFSTVATHAALPPSLKPGSYVLFVSTIEARKNHLLMFRVWRRLLQTRPAHQIPTLVFAGRVGWMVADLMQQIRNTECLGGKLVILSGLSDPDLAALYRGCRFTVYPSHYEGWGLPVTESLGFGKVCLASAESSVPEAGGPFCRYYDPENVADALSVIEAALDDPASIHRMEQRIAAEFRPTPWQETAAALIAGMKPAPAQAIRPDRIAAAAR